MRAWVGTVGLMRGVVDCDDRVRREVHDAEFVACVPGQFTKLLNCVFVAGDGALPDGRAVGKDFEEVVVAIHRASFCVGTLVGVLP